MCFQRLGSVSLFCTLHGYISFLFLYSYTSFFLSVPVGVGVKGTAFPAGTVKSLTRGSNQTQTSKWWVLSSSLSIRLELASGGWFVPSSPPHSGLGFPAENPHAAAGRAGIMRCSWGNKAICPLLVVTLQVCMWNSQPQIQYAESEFGQWCCWVANYRRGHSGKNGILH